MMKPNATRYVILYAEDDLDDLHLVQECFKEYSSQIEIVHAENGRQALQALERLNAKGIQPCLIILDINMPVMDGKQTLAHLKSKAAFQEIPVVLFTTSSSQADREFAQKWRADFITKPLKMSEIVNLAEDFVRRCKIDIRKPA